MAFSFTNRLVLGTAGLGGVWGNVEATVSVETILNALEQGLSAIDTAPAYGDAEEFIGQALGQWTGNKPLISTKVGRLKSYSATEARYDYSADGMKRSVENSLQMLGVSAVDILFLHDPQSIPEADIERILQQMQDLKNQGYTRKLGLGGNAPEFLEPYLEGQLFDVVMEYNKLNACCIDALCTSVPFYIESGKEYYAASPLNMGLLGCNFSAFTAAPPDWLNSDSVEQAKKVNEIAEAYNMPLSVLAHRFLISLPYPVKIVIGAANPQQLTDTLSAFHAGPLTPALYFNILQALIKT